MSDTEYVLREKYVVKLFKEGNELINSIKRFTDSPTNGGLYLTRESVIFKAGDTAITRWSNPMFSRTAEEVYYFSNIESVETGSYKNLMKTIYTLRIYLRNGERKSFAMDGKAKADHWCFEINRQRRRR